MRNKLNFWVVGGDMRQAKLAELLADDGHTVHIFGLERAPELSGVENAEELREAVLADCVVLPLPVEGEGSLLNGPLSAGQHPLSEVFSTFRPGQVLCAGRVSANADTLAAERGLILHDYFRREELAISNAVPVALAV